MIDRRQAPKRFRLPSRSGVELCAPDQLQRATLLLRPPTHWQSWRVSRFGIGCIWCWIYPEREIETLRPLLARRNSAWRSCARVHPVAEDAFIGTVQRPGAREGASVSESWPSAARSSVQFAATGSPWAGVSAAAAQPCHFRFRIRLETKVIPIVVKTSIAVPLSAAYTDSPLATDQFKRSRQSAALAGQRRPGGRCDRIGPGQRRR